MIRQIRIRPNIDEFLGECLVVETCSPIAFANQIIDLFRSRKNILTTPVVNGRFDCVHMTSMPNLVFDAIGAEAEKPRQLAREHRLPAN